MSEAKSPKKQAKKAPVAGKTYAEMAVEAVTALKERGGSSRIAILKYIRANNTTNETSDNRFLKLALKGLVAKGSLKQTKGTGASGSFKLGEKKPAKKVAKKPVKKPAAKPKATPKKKKPAKKAASAKKAAKPKAKAAKKKPAKKAAAKKPVAKKAAKKPAKKTGAKKAGKK